ncbi:alpha/beta hydrolase family protein [Variovorax sp. LT2P21]|uniref:alpha/beta hydrolase family protein n=1 Tax=Variovorax sp. LT2P21 TaxID=3443731 RepID=UPI003F466FFA
MSFLRHLALWATITLGAARALAAPADTTPRPAECPPTVPADARCYNGRDGEGALYWIAIPAQWQRDVLVMHAHGGPTLGAPTLQRGAEDLTRWSVMVKAGYAWAGSTYRRGGYGVTMAAEDTERLRKIFIAHFGPPRRTVLHGQSYGGGVASKAAELYGPVPGERPAYDGVLLTSGVLGGGVDAYAFRLDLRVVYQYVCRNHPKPEEPQYPLWMGLPAGATLTRHQLAERVKGCTGVGLPAAQRSPEQAARLKTILSVAKINERTLVAHLDWATWLFEDLTQKRLEGRNPFGNARVVYSGTADDAALNAGVLRYEADPQAVGMLSNDSRPTGRLRLPVLTLHAIHDPTAFVELESAYRGIVDAAGASDRLVQTFSDESQHSYLSDAEYPALMTSLLDWIDRGDKPTSQKVADLCTRYEAGFGKGCHLRPDYTPPPLATRTPALGR